MKTITFDLISYVSVQNRQINLRKKFEYRTKRLQI